MPEQMAAKDIEDALEHLEDNTLTSNLTRCQNYQTIQIKLESGCKVTDSMVKRLLAVCSHDLKHNMRFANILTIISLILKKFKDGECSPLPEVIQSALAVLHTMKIIVSLNKTQALQKLCFDTIQLYPDYIYTELVNEHCPEIIETIYLYLQNAISNALRLMIFTMLHKILKVLPPSIRLTFVKENVTLWFSRVIPSVMGLISLNKDMVIALDVLELLTEDLEKIDYTENEKWNNVLECIYLPQKYPAVMKALLNDGEDTWCRIWNVLVKLLKQQITMSKAKLGSPINSMLPVVEMAFKMDVPNRVRAFQCWNTLIDNFSMETNENLINKRVKLLIIPLKSNNAKVEDVALAKFYSWWHLIQKYHSRMGFLAELIFVPFLHYCFGNPKVSAEKNVVIPGQISKKLKKLCVQAFIESTGHIDCDCLPSTEFPTLPKKILTPKLLLNHLAEWLYALKATFKLILAEKDSEQETKQIKCIWKSFLIITSKFPEIDRKFVSKELLDLLTQLVKGNHHDEEVLNLVVKIMLPMFFDDVQLRYLLVSKDIQKNSIGPLHKVVTLMLQPELYKFYPSSAPETSLLNLKPITLAVVDKSLSSPNDMVEWVIEELPLNDNGLIFWTSLLESIQEAECDVEADNLKNVLLWPLKNMEYFQHVQHPAAVWNMSYTSMRSRLSKTTIYKDISMILLTNTSSKNQFCLYALLQIIKDVLESPNNTACKMEAELLINILSKIKDYESVVSVMPLIVDSLVLMLTKASDGNDHSLTEFALKASKYTLKIIVESKETGDNERPTFLVQLLKPINKLFSDNAYLKLKCVVLDQLIACSSAFAKHQEVKDIVLSILKIFLSRSNETEVPLVQDAITAIEKGGVNTESKHKDKFSAPKASAKKTKKKSPSILNTVVDNGEDYVVLNTHWKFDPKKLTENQKEKLQRKREDIPALYQDLSQSQDEFKLTSWKTDSQDTSVSNSTSTSTTKEKGNDDASTVLKAMPNTEVVPKIMENIFSDIAKGVPKEPQVDKTVNENVNTDVRSPKINKLTSLSTSKLPRSPRVALKDRVCHNVKVLIEKSAITEAAAITPPKSMNDTINAYSAPPKLSSDRPSRVKRKPRKFETDFLYDLTDSDELRCSSPNTIENKNKEETVSKKVTELKSKKICEHEGGIKKADDSNKTVRTTIKKRRHSVTVNDSQKDDSDFLVPRCSSANIFNKTTKKKIVNKVDEAKSTDKKTGELECDNKNTTANNSNKLRRHSITVSDSQKDLCLSDLFNNQTENKKIALEVTVVKSSDEETSGLKNDNINKLALEKPLNTVKRLDTDTTHCDIIVIDDEHESADNCTEKSKSTEPEVKSDKNVELVSDNTVQKCTASQDEISTPAKTDKSKETDKSKSTSKKPKKSRIEKELAIDMVEGHPLFKAEKRTRKSIIGTVCGNRRKALTEKLSKLSQSDSKIEAKRQRKQNRDSQKDAEEPKNNVVKELFTAKETQDNSSISTDASDLPMSEDYIESSQDTTISVKSTKSSTKKKSKVDLANLRGLVKSSKKATDTQGSGDNSSNTSTDILLTNDETKDDIEFSQNKSVPQESELKDVTAEMDTEPFNDLTANMDTEPIVGNVVPSSDYVSIINDDPEPIEINTDDPVVVFDTQNTANADTEPVDINQFAENGQTEDFTPDIVKSTENVVTEAQIHETTSQTDTPNADTLPMETDQNEPTSTISVSDAESGLSSPFKDDERRNQDFLNNTLEISPIKTMSPIPDNKKPGSPENSSDYVVIRLSSPVSCNGEPLEKSGSPEIFTEDKLSPDKRDQSPPREEVIVNNSSPSSSLSLKKNRPQMRPGNRAAQMLGLCVPDRLQTFMNTEKPTESEETKKPSTLTTPAKRNLRMLYSNGENTENSDELIENNEQNSENFLKFKRALPSADSSPSVPILKRKFTEMDDCAMSPASKRKRVSFHDPPVSTTVAVQKYIEPLGVRSPQTSASKKIDRQTRSANMKSPKKLENVFKLDTALIKTVESFTETTPNSEDIDMSSPEQTPSVEIVKTSELNNTDPICPELLSCLDPISNIASELSSPAMKNLLIQELEGKVETIGDLAKMTELEVNRLCIKAPKVKVAKKVLFDYAEILKQNTESLDTSTDIIEDVPDEIPVEREIVIPGIDVEAQTEKVKLEDTEMQTDIKEYTATQTQTIETLTTSSMSQTEESGSKSTEDIVKSCLERQDFIEVLTKQLDIPSKTKIMTGLPLDAIADVIGEEINESDSKRILDCVIESQETVQCTEIKETNRGLQFLLNYMGKKYSPKDLIYFCRGLLETAHDNMEST